MMKMLETLADIEAYAIKRREEGDKYSVIKKFLHSHWKNPREVAIVIQRVVQLEKMQLLVIHGRKKDYSIINFLMGAFTIILGLVLTCALWERGWVASISGVMIGAGFFGVFKK